MKSKILLLVFNFVCFLSFGNLRFPYQSLRVSVYLSACLPLCPCVFLSTCLLACLLVYLFACLPAHLPAPCLPIFFLPAYVSFRPFKNPGVGPTLSIYLPVCLSSCISVCLPIYLSACLPVCLSACLPVCLSACLPVCLSACLSVCLPACLPVCLSVGLSVNFPFFARSR